ncbi:MULTISPECIES: hypothetical protein [Acetobacteraceae]|uniref:Uncharacterized protein n=1 Tax=Komagataeibacter swingsii TaxID=215220 RepID=A0A850P6R5_9PROT|nr:MULTISPECIES: hypothetical protein [Acetobacteraceae]MBC9010189.1 hypothetical protein [Acetobacter tropicalis]MCG0995480.1 hypothetical protein [Acetobacter indonesiensis]MDO8172104.1 hypothetical protein [Acetobacter tropicalis]NVN38723.1 hypothetical protein [Komagataeibacter swingsii]
MSAKNHLAADALGNPAQMPGAGDELNEITQAHDSIERFDADFSRKGCTSG